MYICIVKSTRMKRVSEFFLIGTYVLICIMVNLMSLSPERPSTEYPKLTFPPVTSATELCLLADCSNIRMLEEQTNGNHNL